jgi:hypothetical protein
LVLVDLSFVSLFVVIIAFFFLFFLIGVLATTDICGFTIPSDDFLLVDYDFFLPSTTDGDWEDASSRVLERNDATF